MAAGRESIGWLVAAVRRLAADRPIRLSCNLRFQLVNDVKRRR
jgi:hypothetical protein